MRRPLPNALDIDVRGGLTEAVTPHAGSARLIELRKATALDAPDRRARPKRLRFAIFTQFGRVVRHAREQFVRLTTRALVAVVSPGLRRLRACAWAGP